MSSQEVIRRAEDALKEYGKGVRTNALYRALLSLHRDMYVPAGYNEYHENLFGQVINALCEIESEGRVLTPSFPKFAFN